jgi:hypothetical protein
VGFASPGVVGESFAPVAFVRGAVAFLSTGLGDFVRGFLVRGTVAFASGGVAEPEASAAD